MNTLMSMSRTQDLRLWFLIDELGALHRLPALEKGLQTARNFGGAIVTGVHAYAKLKDTYGENMAMTLSSLARTKADPRHRRPGNRDLVLRLHRPPAGEGHRGRVQLRL